MKEEIIYLYNFNDIEIHKNNNSIIFFNNGNKYLVEECNKREGELLYIYNISLMLYFLLSIFLAIVVFLSLMP